MWTVLLCLFLGIIIGRFKKMGPKFTKINGKLQQIGIVILLFFMGAITGANKEVLSNMKEIGILSIVFAISSIVFSVILVYFTSKYILERKE